MIHARTHIPEKARPLTRAKDAKPKETASTGSGRTGARRDQFSQHPVAMPSGRERGGGGGGSGGGGFGGDGRHDMHEWMPVSAQQSRIVRSGASIRPGTAMAGAQAFRAAGLKSTVLSLFGRMYLEVLPSIFRRTPEQIDRSDRAIKKDALRKAEIRKEAQGDSRRLAGSGSRANGPAQEERRVLAGDLTPAFAASA